MSVSDEDDNMKQHRMEIMQEQRYGKVVDKIKVTNCLKVTSIVVAVVLIPLEVFIKK